jgi:hypothetical protein
MACRFHEEPLQRLSVQYALDPAAMRALNKRAFALDIAFPASFFEWYTMRNGVALLRTNSNDDEPIEIDSLGTPFQWRWPEKRDLVDEGLLLFMVENQGVCVWALRLDRGDDPPVVVARDPDLQWRPCAASFSTFIGCQVWDHSELWVGTEPGGRRILLQAQDAPLRPDDLHFLRECFQEKPTTHGWPGENQYRFEGDEARLLLWDGEDQADWFITATTEAGLVKVASDLWNCGSLRTVLWSNDERGERLLKKLRE